MIKINLIKKLKGNKKNSGFNLDFNNLSLKGILDSLKNSGSAQTEEKQKFSLSHPVVRLALAFGAIYFLDSELTTERQAKIDAVDAQIAKIEKERNEVEAKLIKIKGFEPIKKQLEEDELAIRTKLETIQKLLASRDIPAKMMLHVANSIPDEVWLTSLAVNDGMTKFSGGTPSYSSVSDFIRALGQNAFFGEISLSGIKQDADSKMGKVQNFELSSGKRGTN